MATSPFNLPAPCRSCEPLLMPRRCLTAALLWLVLLPTAWAGPIGSQNSIFSGIFGGATPAPATTPLASSSQPHPAVCRIIVEEGDGSQSLGSGTLVDLRDNYALVLTNWHVVRDVKGKITVVFPGGFQSLARIRKVDADWDLAALIIWRPQAITPVTLASYNPRLGEPLTIAGYGSGNYRAVTGRCSQFVSPGVRFPPDMLEISVEARQGDSGGPILNDRGELAGVLFGASRGSTTGSHAGRVRWFLTNVLPAERDAAGVNPQAIAQNPPNAYKSPYPAPVSPALTTSAEPPPYVAPTNTPTQPPTQPTTPTQSIAQSPVPSAAAPSAAAANARTTPDDRLGPLVPVPQFTTDQPDLAAFPPAATPTPDSTGAARALPLDTGNENFGTAGMAPVAAGTASQPTLTGDLADSTGRPATAYDEVPRAMVAHRADSLSAANDPAATTAAPRGPGLILDARTFEHLKTILAVIGLAAVGMRVLSGGSSPKSTSKSRSSKR